MPKTQNLTTDWTSSPGDTIMEIINHRNIDLNNLSRQLNQSLNSLEMLIAGTFRIDQNLATLLSKYLGYSEAFWLTREKNYQDDLTRLQCIEDKDEKWLSKLPIKDMISFGWISNHSHRIGILRECLSFFDASSVDEWTKTYLLQYCSLKFRKSAAFDSSVYSMLAWVRQGEKLAKNFDGEIWDKEKFARTISNLRRITRKKNPGLFLEDLVSICRDCGVALVIARTPKECPASGATKMLTSGNPLILIRAHCQMRPVGPAFVAAV